ncbi:xaa-Pro aminopeptidase ApepP-like isoform X2 [Galleria mellonella]|uniref:Xaa-Pro aminopeptidase ApepP-like isoform X2 n=1 Tax=Galleria mellonella TaxID=7137 RepID=A0ABM3MAG0_GALME|nr:xaa-Pro aminopeptidase ApepP-like isoform X2 [Galleria mellonella]
MLGLTYFLVTISLVYGQIRHFNWAEPDGATYDVVDTTRNTIGNSLERLTSMRQVLADYKVDAYIVPTSDAHDSQYLSPADARREWLSGLSGSSGTLVVTANEALLWTDARYFTQFEMQVDTSLWTLMRQGTDPSIQNWLTSNMALDSVVAVDPTTYTRNAWIPLETALKASNVTLEAISENLVDIARTNIGDPPPPRPNNDLIALTVDFTGRRSSDKIAELLSQIRSAGASALVLTALDDIAYTLNLRGSDIPYNPVFFSYLIIKDNVSSPENVILFWGNGVLHSNISDHLQSEGLQIQTRDYSDIFNYLSQYSNSLPIDSTIWLTNDASHAIFLAAESGFRNAHIKDGVALVRGLRWVEEQVAAGANITEIDVSDKLEEFRRMEVDSHGPSFATIAGAGKNGAVIHYKPPLEGSRVIGRNDMLLVDSGGQYKDGTTDITRTRHMSASPTDAQRMTFTRVMKGQISLATVVFPRGTVGHTLESFARRSLWEVGLNYGHGTGHGLGHFLNVHEGPSWILSGPSSTDPGIVEKMIFSNEPGYYEVEEYGIRHEDVVEVIAVTKDADHIHAESIVGDFGGAGALGFHTISLVPHQTACLDVKLLDDLEIKYLNDYHARVLATIGPILKERNLTEDFEWLERECAPISRDAAILVKTSPLLMVVSVATLWLRT